MSVLPKKCNVSRATVFRAVKELNIISYKRSQAHSLTGKMKEVRLRRCKKVLNSVTSPPLKFFSNENIFTVDRSSKTKKEVPKSFRTKSDLCDGPRYFQHCRRLHYHFFKAGEKIKFDVYLGVLKEVVKPWIDGFFQQDSAPTHKAKKTQEWLQANACLRHFPCQCNLPQASIRRQAIKLPTADVTAACKAFRSLIEAVISAEGGNIV
ncbi:Uncharacterized protein FKW44_005121 [Caligus rogercresseyi]|uniref:Uncharacterized protein n=1 Tax=Caligus rogercresseyi TaxID=217165 RepID=A0A7T8KBI0_CALRO|nr:Uncharacterized protein FKW44_005121 [Caligus rogercresseyi]